MVIHGLNKLTLLDYPGRVACTLFTGHCNFRCPFCHNASLVLHPELEPEIPLSEIMDFLKKRKGILTGVAITGGEPMLWDDLPDLMRMIKGEGYQVKLDTNGYRPDLLEAVLREGLADMVAMDIKSSRENYAFAAGLPDLDITRIERSADLLMHSGIPFEFRTTVVRELHTKSDMYDIAEWLAGDEPFFLQGFKDSGMVMRQGLHACTKQEMEELAAILKEKIPKVEIRGVD